MAHYKGPRYKAIDLFAGAGGLTQGLKQAGFDVIGAVEIDALAVETYQSNHPEVRVWPGDINALIATGFMADLGLKPGELDLLAGCPPCQGFSTMRTRNGGRRVTDVRNDLIFDFLRFVKWLKPKTIMMENVPGLIRDYRFRKFCRELYKLGYHSIKFEVQNVADHGVPQRRRRLILIACTGKGIDIKFARPLRRKRTVKNAIGRLPRPSNSKDELHKISEQRSPKIQALIKDIPKDGGSRNALGKERQLECHKRLDGFKDVYGRMAWNDVSPTITTGCFNPSKGRFLHPNEDRCITLREAALLQSFPPKYKFSLRCGKAHAAVMIGNALPPRFIFRHAKQIREALRATKRRSAQEK